MVEAGIVSEQNLFDRMTLAAPFFYTKCGLVIMAGATRLSFFHISHGKAFGSGASGQDGIMAVAAAVKAAVRVMSKNHNSGILDFKGNIRGIVRVALFTVRGDPKGGFAVMAGTAGLALLHLWHVETDAMGATNED